ncbi:MAG: hypothetical protein ACREBC_16955 [Pyrinomonadaceae bacterium]
MSGKQRFRKTEGHEPVGTRVDGERTTTFEDGKLFSVATGHVPALNAGSGRRLKTKEIEPKKEWTGIRQRLTPVFSLGRNRQHLR